MKQTKCFLLVVTLLLCSIVTSAQITSISQLSNTQLYYVSQPYRNATSWAIAEDGDRLRSNVELGITADSIDTRQQFAFISNDDGATRYMYYAANKKFVGKGGLLTDEPIDPIYFTIGAYDNTFIAYFDESNYINVSTNGSTLPMHINDWSTPDGGNSCVIVAVTSFDPTEALRAFGDRSDVCSGTCGSNLTWRLTEDGELVIEGTGAMTNYRDTDEENGAGPWCDYSESIRRVTIIGATSIGDGAFRGCEFASITIPESVTSIGKNAFWGCRNLSSVTVSNGVRSIGNYAFCNCSSLSSITIPESVRSIGEYAFWGNNGYLTSITCEATTPPSVNYLSFEGVVKGVSVYVPASSVDAYQSTQYWSEFTDIRSISADIASGGCGDSLTWRLTEEYELIVEGSGQMTDYTTGIAGTFVANVPWVDYKNLITSVVIGNGVTTIGNSAFESCSNLTSIILPESLTRIGNYAFDLCSSLTHIFIPKNVTDIGFQSLSSCIGLTSLVVDEDNPMYDSRGGCNAVIETGSNKLVRGCSVTVIPEDVAVIGDRSFSGCSSLTSIVIPESVVEIEIYAFEECTGLTSITCEAMMPPTATYVTFMNVDRSIPVYVPASSVSAYQSAQYWDEFSNIQSIPANDIASGTCGENLTWRLTEDGELVIEGVGNMSDYSAGQAPWHYTKDDITKVTIRDGVTSIGDYALYECQNVQTIYISKDVTSIGVNGLRDCFSITALNLPENLQVLKNDAIRGCTGLESVVIPSGVTAIGDNMFYDCWTLTSVEFPASVTSLGKSMFPYCRSLTSITCKAIAPPTATSTTFSSASSSISVYVPASSVSAYQSDQYWRRFTNIQPIDTPVVEEPITSVDQLNNTKLYYVSQPHHSKGLTTSWAVAEDGGELKSNADLGITTDSGDPRQQFAFISRDGVYYLYHAAEKRFVNANGSLSSTPVSPIYFGAGAYENTFVLYFDDTHYVNVGGSREMVINNWKTLDGGNSCSIVPVGEFDPSDALDNEPTLLSYTKIGAGEAELTFADMSLTEVVIPETVVIDGEVCRVTSIGNKVFEGNSNLISATIPSSVTSIEDNAFRDCSNLVSVSIPENSNLMSIGSNAFNACWGLSSIYIPSNVVSIGAYAFFNCFIDGEGTIVVASDNPTYDSRNNCNAIIETSTNTLIKACNSTVIPQGVTTIGNAAFWNCHDIVSIAIPESVTVIEKQAFNGCESLRNINIPDSITTIGMCTFRGCYELEFIILPEELTSIGGEAFRWCYALKSITLPQDVISIGDYAFDGCDDLLSIISYATTPPVCGGANTFAGVDKSIPVYVPASSVSAYQSAQYWSEFTNIQSADEIGDTSDWTSDNQGQSSSVSSKTYAFEVSAGDILTFDWMVSSESNYDKLVVALDGTEVLNESGEQSGTFEKVFVASGTCTLVVRYSKDGSEDRGSDCAKVYNMRLVSADWVSDNHENNSVSSETYTFATIPGGVLSFDWKVSSESNYDYFIATLNGEEVLRKSGEASGTYQYTFTSLGTNTLVLKYTKDGSQSNGSDFAMVYNLTFPATRDVILSDSDASFVQNEDEGCTSITYTRNFKNTNWQALYVPFEIPVTEEFLADYEVAYIYDARQYDHDDDGVKDETLIECFKMKNGTLEANYPYLIRAKVAGVKNIVVTNTTLYATEENSIDCSSVFDTYTFTGTYSRMSSDLLPQDGGYYALSGGSWSPVKEGTSLGAFRFYLKIDSRNGNSNNVANARSIRMRFVGDDEDEETTGIDNSQITIDNSQAVYDLQGRRVDNPTKGVYIVNGKKVILK